MMRLTTDNPETNLEIVFNLFYLKNGETWVRGGGMEPDYEDISLFDYIRSAISNTIGTKSHVLALDNEGLVEGLFDEWIIDGNETIDGIIATLYIAAWAFAGLRERLKHYEDAAPVVRCRECKHRGTNACPMHINGRPADEAFLVPVDDDFCSYGELML